MNPAFEVGATALRAEQKALEILANNIANVNTPSFKRSEALFSEVLGRAAETLDKGQPDRAASPIGGGGSRVDERPMLALQGELRSTGNSLDLAISGAGLIEVIGPGGTPLYWRGGRLTVSDDGLLATADGMPLRAGVIVPIDAQSLTITPDGLVSAITNDQETVEIGEIDLVRFEKDAEIERLTVTDKESGEVGTQTLKVLGSLVDPTTQVLTFTDAASGLSVDLDFTGATSFSSGTVSSLRAAEIDGHGTGTIISLKVNEKGELEAAYSNEETEVQGSIALADFRDPQRLQQRSGGLFTQDGYGQVQYLSAQDPRVTERTNRSTTIFARS